MLKRKTLNILLVLGVLFGLFCSAYGSTNEFESVSNYGSAAINIIWKDTNHENERSNFIKLKLIFKININGDDILSPFIFI